MAIIYIEETDLKSAEALSRQNGNETIVQFESKWPENQSEITLLAHTETDLKYMGGRTPAELAHDFAQKIPPKQRSALKHLYLISCEAGLRKEDKLPLAQQLAQEMKKQGFNSLLVHAVASPHDQPLAGMRVIVTTKGGISRKPEGHVEAFAYPTSYGEKLDDLLEETDQRIDRMRSDSKSELTFSEGKKRALKAEWDRKVADIEVLREFLKTDKNDLKIDILSTLEYKKEMKEPYNTFTADHSEKISFAALFSIGYLHAAKLKVALKPEYSKQEQHIDLIVALLTLLRGGMSTSMEEISLGEIQKNISNSPSWKGLKAKHRPEEITSLLAIHEENLFPMETKLPNEFDLMIKRTHFCQDLWEYHDLRSSDHWDYHYNFLGLVSLVYLILDFCTGSDYFFTQRREVQLSATEKAIRLINGEDIQVAPEQKTTFFTSSNCDKSKSFDNVLTKSELNALKQGGLGNIIEKNGGLAGLNKSPSDMNIQQEGLGEETDPLIGKRAKRHEFLQQMVAKYEHTFEPSKYSHS